MVNLGMQSEVDEALYQVSALFYFKAHSKYQFFEYNL
jgi:hypothetical protein